MGKLVVVVGGQYGSEGKGAVTGWLAKQEERPFAIRVAGPNAGHTVIEDGQTWKLRQLPVAAVTNLDATLAIAAGSEIDGVVLAGELDRLDEAGYNATSRLIVDQQATLIDPWHVDNERSLVSRIGSTGKGIGAARADRIMRTARLAGGQSSVAPAATEALREGRTVIVEGTQGYGLGLHAGWYPYCTSSDCRAVDFLAMAGISPWDEAVTDFEVWIVLRVYPIRVAGDSGPMMDEASWEALGLPPEHTTVTGKVRRVGAWDEELARAAIAANGGASRVRVALTMVDQLVDPEDERGVAKCVEELSSSLMCPISLVGTGPARLRPWPTSGTGG